ncbi:helix-turn-helix transcriptional regulator [Deinococcota bacterium DY0809b]
MYPRYLAPRLERALGRSPVVYLAGARQVNKAALARRLAGERGMACYTLDDPAAPEAARTDPVGLVSGLARAGTPPTLPFDAPTPRERQVLRLLAQGHCSDAIAQALGVKRDTVYIYLQNLREKLGAESQHELVLAYLDALAQPETPNG